MPTPEQVKAFEKQIETSLDFEVDALRVLDEKKSETLKKLKKDILAQMKLAREDDAKTPEKEEQYSADLRLTEAELQSIFESLRATHQKLFDENEIADFDQFRIFFGLYDPEIKFAESLQKIEIWGKRVELPLPLAINETMAINYRKALEQVEKRADLKSFITPSTRFIPRGGARLEFTIRRDGKAVKYSASPEALLRVDQEPPPVKIREWVQLSLQIHQLEQALSYQALHDPSLASEQMAMLFQRATVKKERQDPPPSDKYRLPEKYQTAADELDALRSQKDPLETECSVRMLFDETNGMTVKEEGDPGYLANFSYEYSNTENEKTTYVRYISNEKRQIVENDPNNENEQIATTITIFYSWGKIQSFEEMDSKGGTTLKIQYRENGTVESKRIGNNEDVYDEKGEKILYRRIWPDGNGTVKNAMVAKDGKSFSTLDAMREEKPSISDSEYLDYLAENLDTPEKLHLFFELFMRYVHDNPKLKDATYKTPNIGGEKDYWQTPEETIHRTKEGKMLGDCDDYAFLAKAILQRQGKTAYVIGIPNHAECIWIEKRPDGNWDAYSMGTFGLDKNGNRYGQTPDPEKEKGYPTLEEALNSLMAKYDEGGLGLEKGTKKPYRVHETIDIQNVPSRGKKTWSDIPIEILPNQKLVDMYFAASEYRKAGAYHKAIESYRALIREDPQHPDIYHGALADALWQGAQPMNLEQAVNTLSTCINAYPDRPEYHATLGKIYIEKTNDSDDTKAEEQLKLAVEKGTTDENVFSKLATFNANRGDKDGEVRILELAVERCPNLSSWIHERLALAYVAQGKTEKAVAAYEEIIRRNPDAYAIKIDLAKLYHETDPEKAKVIYEQLLLEDPENPQFSLAYARFYKDTGNQSMQILFLEKLIQQGKIVIDALLQLVPLYEQENKKDDIRRICKLAREKKPESNMLRAEIRRIKKRNGITE